MRRAIPPEADDADQSVWYAISYDDGDAEDLNVAECEVCSDGSVRVL